MNRLSGRPEPALRDVYGGLVTPRADGGLDWTGIVRMLPERLEQPRHWGRPRRVYVCPQADLFHPQVPDEFIERVWGAMAACPQHTFLVLSKRVARMRAFLSTPGRVHAIAKACDAAQVDHDHDPEEQWRPIPGFEGYEASSHGRLRGRDGAILKTHANPHTARESVTLWNRGEPKTMTVHQLVLIAHRPIAESANVETCHRNGNKADNRLANLRWGSRSDNHREAWRHNGTGGPCKLSFEEVEAIRAARQRNETQQSIADRFGVARSLISLIEHRHVWHGPDLPWPLPNVWLGVTAENQRRADERIPELLATPAAVRWVSLEPLLGPIDLECLPGRLPHRVEVGTHNALSGEWWPAVGNAAEEHATRERELPGLDLVIAGGESGGPPERRLVERCPDFSPAGAPLPDCDRCSGTGWAPKPEALGWVRSLREQCTAAGVAWWFKGWAGPTAQSGGRLLEGRTWEQLPAAGGVRP